MELLECFRRQAIFRNEGVVGKEAKIRVRMICHKLTEEQSLARRRKANKLAKSHDLPKGIRNC